MHSWQTFNSWIQASTNTLAKLVSAHAGKHVATLLEYFLSCNQILLVHINNQKQLKDELQHIISGIGRTQPKNFIETVASYLRAGEGTNKQTEATKLSKQEETEALEFLATQQNLWVDKSEKLFYLAEGAEQKVYITEDGTFVLKFNDSIFYAYWLDYFISLILHNYFFPETAYTLIGFYKDGNHLYAVVKQPFVLIHEPTNLELIKEFLLSNGFAHKKNHDYFNEYLGLILEDLHDENVLTNSDELFFIDTVF